MIGARVSARLGSLRRPSAFVLPSSSPLPPRATRRNLLPLSRSRETARPCFARVPDTGVCRFYPAFSLVLRLFLFFPLPLSQPKRARRVRSSRSIRAGRVSSASLCTSASIDSSESLLNIWTMREKEGGRELSLNFRCSKRLAIESRTRSPERAKWQN